MLLCLSCCKWLGGSLQTERWAAGRELWGRMDPARSGGLVVWSGYCQGGWLSHWPRCHPRSLDWTDCSGCSCWSWTGGFGSPCVGTLSDHHPVYSFCLPTPPCAATTHPMHPSPSPAPACHRLAPYISNSHIYNFIFIYESKYIHCIKIKGKPGKVKR